MCLVSMGIWQYRHLHWCKYAKHQWVFASIGILILISKLLRCYVKKNILQDQTAFTMSSNMASGLMENVILTNIILTTNATIGCMKSDTWCQMVLAPNFGAGPHAYHCCWMWPQTIQPPAPYSPGGWLSVVSIWVMGLFEVGAGILSRISSHIWE